MSTFTPVQIRCQHCGKEFVIELLEGIHITRLPEVRDEIINGTFQVFTCESCSTPVHVENDTIYTDFDKKHYVAVQSSTLEDWRSAKAGQAQVFFENFDGGPDIARELGEGFTHRVVPDIAALREKLLVWDAGLDDRVVEAVKGSRQRDLGIDHWSELWRVSAVLDGGHLMFARLRPLESGGFELIGHETVPNDQYLRWASGDELEWEFSLLLDDWVVDLFVLYLSARPGGLPSEIPPGPKGRHWEFQGSGVDRPEVELPPPFDSAVPLVEEHSDLPPPPPPPPSRVDEGPPPPVD